ncbi:MULTISPECIES: hypothetical protein [unclassified Mesorhizobium]|uniref:hypothetical protein n=1 Tax=unclassified Mesorhizobium TaxID=325217 RepID=UPI001CCBE1ED|nr:MULTISPECIES: hypothetical protein [unclassified Mesorhizobium]MBZ9683444.1 hypothetical protein [Mesorhizobium sp. CO1-1-2]MBZ9698438.1 hypothetical protein [Mesorhizobium sp. CO1-1-9]MBZ9928187.1 hypothetical protein [Mesorhizobium sp. BR1-1-4]
MSNSGVIRFGRTYFASSHGESVTKPLTRWSVTRLRTMAVMATSSPTLMLAYGL